MQDNIIYYDDSELQRKISIVERNLSDTTEFYNDLGVQASEDIIQHFVDEMGPSGKWQDVKPATKKAKIRGKRTNKRYTNKILSNTGKMRQITHNIQQNGVLVGTTVNYGEYHQKGTGHLPQRIWAYISDKGRQKLNTVVNGYIAGAFGKAGFKDV